MKNLKNRFVYKNDKNNNVNEIKEKDKESVERKKKSKTIYIDSVGKDIDSVSFEGYYNNCLNFVVTCTAIILAFMLWVVTLIFVFGTLNVLNPPCPAVYGRECNQQGSCINGNCVCNNLFSGKDCSFTLIPGYDPVTNVVCNGYGFVYPYIQVPEVCQEVIYDSTRFGGWNVEACIVYVTQMQSLIAAQNGDLSKIPGSNTIPTCLCKAGRTGMACGLGSCPEDENGLVCAGHGNTSVGLISNYTNAGNGCQCKYLIAFYESTFANWFSPEVLNDFIVNYNVGYNDLYCGHIIQVVNPQTGKTELNNIIAYSIPSDYVCFCDDLTKGETCSEGRCPLSIDRDVVCSGNGHPNFGIGYNSNSIFSKVRGLECTLNCVEDHELCNNKCIPPFIRLGKLSSSITSNRYCLSPNACRFETPVRCMDGSCATLPLKNSKNCGLGFQYGTIDYSQLEQAFNIYRCNNVTNRAIFEQCFLNTSVIDYVIGYSNQIGGGIFVSEQINRNAIITLNLTSPLVYFQFFTNASNTAVSNFNGDVLYFNNPGVLSGLFNYSETTRWGTVYDWDMIVSPSTSNRYYYLSPAPFNYSELGTYNSSYTNFRVINIDFQRKLVLHLEHAFLNYSVVDYEGVDLAFNGVLVKFNISSFTLTQPLWLNPLASAGELLSNEQCLTLPQNCSWYISKTEGQIRNLQSTLYVCPREEDSSVILSTQTSECNIPLSVIFDTFDAQIYIWDTSLYAQADDDYNPYIFNVHQYQFEIDPSTPYQVQIYWTKTVNDFVVNQTYFLNDFGFLTLDNGITFPCACDISPTFSNQSSLNLLYWNDVNTRTLTDTNIEIGDLVVFADYNSGYRELKRGIISQIDTLSDVIVVLDKYGTSHYIFYNAARKITGYEYTFGEDDTNRLLAPFKCPDGTAVKGEIVDVDLNVHCNCTLLPIDSPEIQSNGQFNCSCIDDDVIPNKWSCVCSISDCICGLPVSSNFGKEFATLLGTLNNECQCIVFEGREAMNSNDTVNNITATNHYIRATNVDTWEETFEFVAESIPQVINIQFEECDGYESFIIVGGSSYFLTETSVNIDYTTKNIGDSIGNWVRSCEYFLTLLYDNNMVLTNMTIETNSTYPMSNITIELAFYGISLIETQSIQTGVVTFASSNDDSSSNVLYLGSEGWSSSHLLYENPVYIGIYLSMEYYLNSYFIIFKGSGRLYGEFKLPQQYYLQGSNNYDDWYNLDNFSLYIDSSWDSDPYTDNRYQIFRTIPEVNSTYSIYRLITFGFPMDLLYLNLYSNVLCLCPGYSDMNNFGLAFQIENLTGLLNTTAEYELYQYRINNTVVIDNCISTNNCTLFGTDVTYNGICNDVKYQAYLLGIEEETYVKNEVYYTPNNITSGTSTFDYQYYLYENDLEYLNLGVIQFAVSVDDFLSNSALIVFYDETFGLQTLADNVTGLIVMYTTKDTTLWYPFSTTLDEWEWEPGTFNIYEREYGSKWGDLIERGAACELGTDYIDCGGSNRIPPLLPGVGCVILNPLNVFRGFPGSSSSYFYRAYFLYGFNGIIGDWFATFINIPLTRTKSRLYLRECGDEVCYIDNPYKCKNGECVKNRDLCKDRYTCPGNGCVKLLDISAYDAYRCACKPGHNGDACQYGIAKPATPLLGAGEARVPGAEEIMCGGPPPFMIKPPVLNLKSYYLTEELDSINMLVTGNSVPLSNEDIGYHRVMPRFGPFGQVVTRIAKMQISDLLPNEFELIRTTCPCMRRGYRGEYIFINDDYSYKNIFTGKKTWKKYINPYTNATETFPWTGVCTYDDFVYRCPGGGCVKNKVSCTLKDLQYPVCNGRGKCLSDGTCSCYNPYRTFLINNEFSNFISYPYTYIQGYNSTDPTVWVMNDNWRLYSQDQCVARDCTNDGCKVPKGCFTGTPELDFADKEVLCENNNLCAKNLNECYSLLNLKAPKDCSGNGIKRVKDVTNEEYCECCKPISPLLDISDVTELSQCKKNGFGDVYCNKYYANQNVPLFYSTFNFKTNSPYYSTITGKALPGVWVKGVVIMGPKPEDFPEWSKCCQGYTELEACPFTLCQVPPDILCLPIQECLDYSDSAPRVYECNGHGVARADGTCLCDTDEITGEGYSADFTQFSYDGCFKFNKCPQSLISNTPCNIVSQCEDPSEWRYPFTNSKYFNQQWWTCSGAPGPYDNQTRLQLLTLPVEEFKKEVESAMAKIAISVIESEAAYQGCVCFYPTDTFDSRCCMVLNAINYTYMQAFQSPYLLALTPDDTFYDKLVYGDVYPAGIEQLDFYVEEGDEILFTLDTNDTLINFIRVMSTGDAVLGFYDADTDQLICPTITLLTYEIDYNYPLFNWDSGDTLGGAANCGPFYTCVAGSSFPLYNEFCGIRADTDDCESYRKSSCEESGGNYWPVESNNIYYGCLRVDDIDDCRCCLRESPLTLVTNRHLKLKVLEGATFLIKLRVYGNTQRVLTIPEGLKKVLSNGLGYESDCQDDKFLRSRLNGDHSYYFPTVETSDFATARSICENQGGYLAVGELAGNELVNASQSYKDIQLLCSQITNGAGKCWVNAVSLKNTIDVPRNLIFNSQCDAWGCYQDILFYTNNTEFSYNTSYFTKIGYDKVQQTTTDYVIRLNEITAKYDSPIEFYINTYYDGSEYKAINISNSDNGCNGHMTFFGSGELSVQPIRYFCDNTYKVAINIGNDSPRFFDSSYLPVGTFISAYRLFGLEASLKNIPINGLNIKGNTNFILTVAPDPIFCAFKYSSGLLMDISDPVAAVTDYFNAPSTIPNIDYNALKNNMYLIDFGPEKILNYLRNICTGLNNFIQQSPTNFVLCVYVEVGGLYWPCFSYDSNGNVQPQTDPIISAYCGARNWKTCSALPQIKYFIDRYCFSFSPSLQMIQNFDYYLNSPDRSSIVLKPGCLYYFISSSLQTQEKCGILPATYYTSNKINFIPNILTSSCYAVQYVKDDDKRILTSFVTSNVKTQFFTSGTVGLNKVFGYSEKPYMPTFIDGTLYPYTLRKRPVTDSSAYLAMKYLNSEGRVLPFSPVYLINDPKYGFNSYSGWLPASNVLACVDCPSKKQNTCYWDQLYASENVWKNQFTCQLPPIYIQLPASDIALLTDYNSQGNYAIFIHQMLYIQNYTFNSNPLVNWFLPTCVYVSSNGINIDFCTKSNYNMICQYDWTKYACVTGTMCDACGCSTRVGGSPIPALTCGQDNPLRNSTLFPFQALITKNYQLGTLSEFINSYNLQPETFNYENTSLILGYPIPSLLWKTGYSSRPGSTSFNVDPNQNWCDLCLTCHYPVDCGLQIDPYTNKFYRYCSSKIEFCNLNLNESQISGSIMNENLRPQIVKPVDPSLSLIDPTCGPNVPLNSYYRNDRFGGPQSDLNAYEKILIITTQYVQFQVASASTLWFNGGKVVTDYVFEQDLESFISGYYKLELCTSCVDPIMEVLIHPINIEYRFPELYLSVNVSLTENILTSYTVSFTVTEADTGSYEVNGEIFPLHVFKAIGYKFYGLSIGSMITLYNPVIVNDESRQVCETRVSPPWYEPDARIESSAPLRKCILTKDDQSYFPNTQIGQCSCDLSTAGKKCDCQAVTSKYGKEVCGGFGDQNSYVKGYDNIYYTTGEGTEAGCFYSVLPSGKKISDCKTISLGRSIFSLNTDGAIFNYPSVYVETTPLRGSSVFRFFDNNNIPETWEESKDSCNSQGMYLPYFFTLDEINQFIVDTNQFKPVFIGVDNTLSTETQWPWIPVGIGYFMNNPEIEIVSDFGTCDPVLSCGIVNFNNFAFGAAVTGSASYQYINDGNTNSVIVNAGTYNVKWAETSKLEVDIYIFPVIDTSKITLTCTGGICDTWDTTNINFMFITCRCPAMYLTFTLTGVSIAELQIFNENDNIRSHSYNYN